MPVFHSLIHAYNGPGAKVLCNNTHNNTQFYVFNAFNPLPEDKL